MNGVAFIRRWFWVWLFGLPLLALAIWGIVDNERLFFATTLNGLTLAALYFLVASGFTLVFGLMRNVNLAHGSLYLLGAYVGWVVGELLGLLAPGGRRGLPVRRPDRPRCCRSACSATCTARTCARPWRPSRLSIIAADVALWIWGGEIYQFDPPRWIIGSTAAADRRQVRDLPAGPAGHGHRHRRWPCGGSWPARASA